MIIEVIGDPETGEAYIELPDDICEKLDFQIGDTILWVDNQDGSYTLKKHVS